MGNPYDPGAGCHFKCIFYNTKFDFKVCLGHRNPGTGCDRPDPEGCPFIHTPPPIMKDMIRAMDLWDFPDGRGSNEDINIAPGRFEEMVYNQIAKGSKRLILVLGLRDRTYIKWFIHSKIHIEWDDKLISGSFWVEHNSSLDEDGSNTFLLVKSRCNDIRKAWRREGLKIIGE